ncbi:MAG: hypothetical protein JW829_21160, partial [Pirellulales bacterium]|nr:hypothetical protein [Pirellulales bacterium]
GMGGMGGMGGGMGGGMFNVTDGSGTQDTEPTHPAVVPDSESPNLTRTKTANPTDSNVADPPTKSTSSGISMNLETDPETVWNGFFQGRQTDPADVRQLVRELMRSGQTKHAIALIQAALCHGQPQAWMYEALGIAMDIDGRSREEIERAVMSSVEFVTSPAELLYIAGYLSRTGFDQRALQLAQQAVQIQPLAYEAYLLGLESAQRLNDVDGIRWATVGLLSQEWTKEQSDVQNRAFRAARALLDQLQKEGRKKEFTEYQQQLDEAMIRDCVVVVRWTGDADVDLIVAEPGDTLCSLHTPRTTSGGINLGDTYARFNRQNEDGFSETYICPKGFPGQYRVRVRRVWGEVTAGKVTVDVYIHYRTKQQKHERQQINLGKDDALVIFNLDHGRRTESLEQQQVASAVQQHVGLNRAILAQQINAVADPNVIPQRDLPIGSTGPRPVIGRGPDGRPFAIGNSAVGYQPVIITLPEGTNFWATGVVSADRRYVRITSVPFFSGIGDVTTFTYSGSAEETDDDDGGDDDGGDDDGGDDDG